LLVVWPGLSLKDYLEGREAQHNELMMRVYGGKSAMRLDDDTTYLDSEVSRSVLGLRPAPAYRLLHCVLL
jgi:hypothetical protein